MPRAQSSFNDRVKRITNPKNAYYVDPETGTFIPKRVSKQEIKKAKLRRQIPKPGVPGFIGSLLMGALCLMAARYLRFNELEMHDGSAAADVLMTIDFGLAAIAVFLLGAMVRHTTFRHMIAQTVGIGIMLVTMHNLVWAFPEEFAQVYSSEYVDQVRSLTAPQSLYLRGETITL